MLIFFKSYKHSKLATVFSYVGSICLLLGILMLLSVVGCISRGDWSTTALLESWLPMVALFVFGALLKWLANRRANTVMEQKLREDVAFAVTIAMENPEAAEDIKALNPTAAEAIDAALRTQATTDTAAQ